MKAEKKLLREKCIQFQLKIAELSRALQKQADCQRAREKDLFSGLFEILDAFENLAQTIKIKEDQLHKTGRRMAKSVESIHSKLIRLLDAHQISAIEFPDNKARMEHCRIFETQPSPGLKDETILMVVKKGYMDQTRQEVLRKADVITVFNP